MDALEVLRRAQGRLRRCSSSQTIRLSLAIHEIEEIVEIANDPECEGSEEAEHVG